MGQTGSSEHDYFSGKSLYGDDFDIPQIQQWFTAEQNAYYELAGRHREYHYSYHALNWRLGYRHLRDHYRLCVALGCAAGDDVSPLAARVDEFLAIEPAEQWWRDRIAQTPARYLKPSVTGDIPLTPSTADLVVALGVLHHVPNVSHLLDEIARVLAGGGHFVLREPISSMGDWRKPRRGLTANERGLPVKWLEAGFRARGFDVIKKTFCCFGPLARVGARLGIRAPYNRRSVVALDSLLCKLTKWNLHYHRECLWHKLAPGAVCYLLQKRRHPPA